MLSCSGAEGKEGGKGREGRGRGGGGGGEDLTLTLHDYLYLIATVIWLGTRYRDEGAARAGQIASFFFFFFWMEFLPLNKWLPVAGVIGF